MKMVRNTDSPSVTGNGDARSLPSDPRPAKVYRVQPTPTRNSEIDWETFQPRAYHANNYRSLRSDDLEIVGAVRDFFSTAELPGRPLRGLDVGPGANLYPAFAMLPLCEHVDLIEYSAANVRWLRGRQRWWRRFDRSWDPFWRLYSETPRYARLTVGRHPLAELRAKATISQGSIFDLPEQQWDIGTMFFVACSLSADRSEFEQAVRRFTRALKPDAPFAAGFMTGSDGYEINGVHFPAVPIDAAVIEETMQPLASDVKVIPIDSEHPLRPDVGMALAVGYSRGA
jgi:hypothetical protein